MVRDNTFYVHRWWNLIGIGLAGINHLDCDVVHEPKAPVRYHGSLWLNQLRCQMRRRTIEPIKHLSVKAAIAVCSPLFQLCTPKSYEATLRVEPQVSVVIFDRRENRITWKAIATIQYTPDFAVPAKQALVR